MSDEQRAKSNIMLRARTNRTVTTHNLSVYARSQLEGVDSVESGALKIGSILDVRMYQTLSRLSLQMSAKSRKMRMDALSMTKGFTVKLAGEEESPHEHISSIPFTVEARKASKKAD